MVPFYRNNKLIEWNPDEPVITCLMSVYNGQTYLREAMDSILDQTYTNFEFLIINDGSTDDTVSIIESYDDPRIRLVHNEVNIGLTKSLNKGIDLAKGEYIARMDADDISLPERFERQLEIMSFMNIELVAGRSVNDNFGFLKYDVDQLILQNIFVHSSMFAKSSSLRLIGKYDEEYKYCQDYELWTRYIKFYKNKIFFYKTPLVKIRNHNNRLSNNNSAQQYLYGRIIKNNIDKIVGINFLNHIYASIIGGNYTGYLNRFMKIKSTILRFVIVSILKSKGYNVRYS